MKKTVSPYVNGANWDLCRDFGFNMSEEIDKLMEILLATALEITDEEGKVMMTRRIRLERQLELLDDKKEKLSKELKVATEQEKRFKEKLKTIEDNKTYTDLIKELNEIIVSKGYSIREVSGDPKANKIIGELKKVGPWTRSDLSGHISKLRKIIEGF